MTLIYPPHTLSFPHCAISFNGGKDCNVLLHLLYLYVCKRFGVDHMRSLRCLTWHRADAFPAVADNMAVCERVYSLTVDCLDGSFRDGLQLAVDRHAVRAIFMGQRRADPFAAPTIFAPTSPGWPPVMRVNPLLDWSYHDIWLFTRLERVPVCALYRVGFTSLGPRDLTVPNPALRQPRAVTDDCEDSYAPAWALSDGALERAGRLDAKQAPLTSSASERVENVGDVAP